MSAIFCGQQQLEFLQAVSEVIALLLGSKHQLPGRSPCFQLQLPTDIPDFRKCAEFKPYVQACMRGGIAGMLSNNIDLPICLQPHKQHTV